MASAVISDTKGGALSGDLDGRRMTGLKLRQRVQRQGLYGHGDDVQGILCTQGLQ